MNSRKITLQLTPLLDLFLIIIFTQYLEMDGRVEELQHAARDQVAAVESELDQSKSDLAELLANYEDVSRELSNRLRELSQAKDELRERVDERESFREQRDSLAMLLPELFDLSDSATQELLKTRAPQATRMSPQQMARLKQEFQKLAQKKPDVALRHLLTFDEMKKRCDLWQLYLTDDGVCVLSTDRQVFRFVAETSDEFVSELFQRYKQLPEAKSLVIVLMSHGNSSAGVREAATEGLPIATRRMAEDANGRTRFEYGLLGYTKDPPISGVSSGKLP